MDAVVFWYIVHLSPLRKCMFTDYFARRRKQKNMPNCLLYVTVKERLSNKLHNDAPALQQT